MITSIAPHRAPEFPTPADIEGFWQFDRVHAPHPLTPLSQDVLLPAFGEGMTAGLQEVGYPHGFAMRAVNNFAYLGLIASQARGEALQQQFAVHRRAVASLIPKLAHLWHKDWLPSIQPGLARLRTFDFGSLSDAALIDALADLRVELIARWRIHGRILPVYLAVSDFEDFYRARLYPTDPTEPYVLLHGFSTRALESRRGLWRLSRLAAASPVARVFHNSTPQRVAEVLAQTPDGIAFLRELRRYLDSDGWRNDAVFELADPMWCEDPTRPLAAIQGQLSLAADADPDVQLQRSARAREELVRQARGRLAEDPAVLAHFDELYAHALPYLEIDEDHNFYMDQMGNAGMRRPILEIGSRLARRGSIAAPEDVFFLHVDEIKDAMSGTDYRDSIAARRADLRGLATVSPPDTLGTPPTDDVVDPLLSALAKQDTTPATGDTTSTSVITGTPGSGGIVSGRARVARSLSEACAVQPGEVLVCEMTLPTWTPLFSTIAAVVSDTGGVLSHCAIVARECGIPCVVSTLIGTHTIRTGMLLTVDGSRGTVDIHVEH